jgi:hypothetical protein
MTLRPQTGRVRLLHRARWPDAPGRALRELKFASPNGRQLYTLAADWPELARRDRLVGVYHALGQERRAQMHAALDELDRGGFDGIRPSAGVFEHQPHGPFTSLAVALGCEGPFQVLEGDGLCGGLAVLSALTDLQRGRCELALVGGWLPQDHAWLMLLEAVKLPVGHAVRRWTAAWDGDPAAEIRVAQALRGMPTFLVPAADDPHGLEALGEALEGATDGSPHAVSLRSSDGRRLLLGFAGGPGDLA